MLSIWSFMRAPSPEMGIVMKITACPFCGGAAESGYIHSSRQIIWSGEKKEGFFLAGDGDVKVTKDVLKPGIADSFVCPRCKIIFTPIE